ETLTPEQRNSVATSMIFADDFNEAGIPISRREHLLNLAEQAQDDSLIMAGYLSGEKGISDAVTLGVNEVISQEYQRKLDAWQLNNPETVGNIPASVQRALMEQTQEEFKNVTGAQG